MAYNIKLVKIVTGELVIGKYDEAAKALNEVAILQIVPNQQGVQIMMLPYGYPFEQEFVGKIEATHFMYEYAKLPDDIETRYLEVISNLTLGGGLVGGSGKPDLIS